MMARLPIAVLACALVLTAIGSTAEAQDNQATIAIPLGEQELQTEWRKLSEEQAEQITFRNMRGLVRAMHKYHDAHGCLPPAVVPNSDLAVEKRLSGFVLLLPFLDATDYAKDGSDSKDGQRFFTPELSAMAAALYKTMDLTKAWDDPVNLQAAETIVPAFLAPQVGAFRDKNGHAVSHFALVRGAIGKDDGAFTETFGITYFPSEERKLRISDGTANTLALGQINDGLGPWTAAGTATARFVYHRADNSTAPTFRSRHAGGCYFVNCDSGAYFLDLDKTSANTLHALATRGGDEPIDSSSLFRYESAAEWKKKK